jgi:putative heme-binding domain-containing protein
MHGLYALHGLGALNEDDVTLAMVDANPIVRRHAVRLAEQFIREGALPDGPWGGLKQLAADGDVDVRYQVAWTLGLLKDTAEKRRMLLTIASADVAYPWSQAAALNSLKEGVGQVLIAGMASNGLRTEAAGQGFLKELARLVGVRHDREELALVTAALAKETDFGVRLPLTRGLDEGLRQAGSSLNKEGVDVAAMIARAEALAGDASAADAARRQAVEFLALAPYERTGQRLLALLEKESREDVRLTALGTLDTYAQPQLAGELLRRLAGMTPRLRAEAIGVLVKRPERAMALLREIEGGKVRASELSAGQKDLLRNHGDTSVRELAIKVLGAAPAGSRQDVVKAYSAAAEMKGDPARGRALFTERCSSCHRVGEVGFALGPDLTSVRSAGRESLLTSILDPNREVPSQYLAYVVDTKAGETLVGLVVNESGSTVTLRQAYGIESAIPRDQIRRMRATNRSLMPEGLEEGLKPQDVADLLEFISGGK